MHRIPRVDLLEILDRVLRVDLLNDVDRDRRVDCYWILLTECLEWSYWMMVWTEHIVDLSDTVD